MIRIGRPIRNKSLSVDTNGAINGLVSIQGLWRGNQEGKKCEHVANSRFSKGWLLFSYLGSEENVTLGLGTILSGVCILWL